MNWDKNCLIGKGEAIYASKVKQGIHLLLLISKQMFGHFWERMASSLTFHCTWKDRHHHSKCPLTQLLLLRMLLYHIGISLLSAGSAVLVVSPSSFLCTSSSYNIGVLSTLFVTNPENAHERYLEMQQAFYHTKSVQIRRMFFLWKATS